MLNNRDTFSDCGDKKSDFYDHFYKMWNNGVKSIRNPKTLTKNSKSGKTVKKNENCSYYPTTLSIKSDFINAGETDFTSEPILVVTEPPKQLKLEQFLQHLSKLNFSDYQAGSFVMGKSMQNTRDANVNAMINVPFSNSVVFPEQSSTVVSSSGTVTTSGIVTSNSGSTHCQSLTSANEHQQHQKAAMISKKKRNTTNSTTTSGHGTISEGECSSIFSALPLTSGVCSKSIKANGNTAGANSVTSNSASTPGSGTSGIASGGGVGGGLQRNPTSSGYESTIQDDEDEFLEDEHYDLEYLNDNETNTEVTVDTGGGNCFGYSKRKKKKRIWTNKLDQYNQSYISVQSTSLRAQNSVTIGQPATTCLDVNGITTTIVDPKNADPHFIEQSTSDSNVCSFFCCSLKKSI